MRRVALLVAGALVHCAGPANAPAAVTPPEEPVFAPTLDASPTNTAEVDLDAGVELAPRPRPRRPRAAPPSSAAATLRCRVERRVFDIADASVVVEGCAPDPDGGPSD